MTKAPALTTHSLVTKLHIITQDCHLLGRRLDHRQCRVLLHPEALHRRRRRRRVSHRGLPGSLLKRLGHLRLQDSHRAYHDNLPTWLELLQYDRLFPPRLVLERMITIRTIITLRRQHHHRSKPLPKARSRRQGQRGCKAISTILQLQLPPRICQQTHLMRRNHQLAWELLNHLSLGNRWTSRAQAPVVGLWMRQDHQWSTALWQRI